MKYDEDKYAREILEHIESTYGGHYVGRDQVQSLDLIFAADHGLGFAIGNAIKYLARFGKKEGLNRKDLLKAAHYVILALHVHDRDVRENGQEDTESERQYSHTDGGAA